MLLVVQSQAAYGPDILSRQRCKEKFHFSDLFGDVVLTKDIALDYLRPGCFGDVTDSSWKEGIAVVNLAVFGQETDQAL